LGRFIGYVGAKGQQKLRVNRNATRVQCGDSRRGHHDKLLVGFFPKTLEKSCLTRPCFSRKENMLRGGVDKISG